MTDKELWDIVVNYTTNLADKEINNSAYIDSNGNSVSKNPDSPFEKIGTYQPYKFIGNDITNISSESFSPIALEKFIFLKSVYNEILSGMIDDINTLKVPKVPVSYNNSERNFNIVYQNTLSTSIFVNVGFSVVGINEGTYAAALFGDNLATPVTYRMSVEGVINFVGRYESQITFIVPPLQYYKIETSVSGVSNSIDVDSWEETPI